MKRREIEALITEAVDGRLQGEQLRELVETLEGYPDLEAEFHAQMRRPDLAAALGIPEPRPGFELRLAARMEAAGTGSGLSAGLEQEIIRFFRRYVVAAAVASLLLVATVLPALRVPQSVDAASFEQFLYGHSADELFSEAVLPDWVDFPLAEEQR